MKPLKIILIVLVVVWIALGVATLAPHETAHRVSYLGYKAYCSFAPYSTVILFGLAGAFFLVTRKLA